MKEKRLIEIGEWLNTQGFDLDLSDDFWMEDCRFGEHKVRDIAELLDDFCNQEMEKRIKEMMGAEIEEFGIYVDLLKADADLMPDKHDYYKRGAQMAYSHCWFTFYRILEKLRSRLTSSEKPNNSEQQMWRDIQENERYPDTEADGFVFCGKCGKMKEI